jgi:hypothetical protein
MASGFLTDRFEELISTLHPSIFLVGWIRNRTLTLSCANPRVRSESWTRTGLSLSGASPLNGFSDLPLSPLQRKSAPFLLLWPSEWCFGSLVELPASVISSERGAAISALLEPVLPWPAEEVVLAWDLDISPQAPSSPCYAWATPFSPLKDLMELLQDEGLDPRWVIPESFLLSHRLTSSSPDPAGDRFSGLISGDLSRTHCMILKGHHIKGESTILHEGNEGLSLREHRLADQLLFFLSSGRIPDVLFRTREIPASPLVDRLTLPSPVITDRGEPTGYGAWNLTRALSRDRANALSFRKDALSWQGDLAEQKSGFRVLAALAVVLVLVLILDAGVHLSRMDHRISRAREALDRAATLALPGHRIVEPVTQLKQELQVLNRQKGLLSRGPDIIRIMKDLTSAPPNGVPFEVVSVNVTKSHVIVSGKTDSFKSVEQIRKGLAASGHMRKLAILSAGIDIDRKTVSFRIRGRHD